VTVADSGTIYRPGGGSLPKAISDRLDRDGRTVVCVARGAKIRSSLDLIWGGGYDVAAYVHLPSGPSAVRVRPFSGVGFVHTTTLAFSDTEAAHRVLARWQERCSAFPDLPEAQNLAITLTEISDARLLHLPPEYAWNESLRHFVPTPGPIVVECSPSGMKSAPTAPSTPVDLPEAGPWRERPSAVLQSHFSQYTGYGKMAREILFRLANSLTVRIDDSHREPVSIEQNLQVRIEAHKSVLVRDGSPFLRIMGPEDTTGRKGHRIVWTMQETADRVHPNMVERANWHWDELWTPTKWNADVFRASGVRLPIRVMRLGVNSTIFRPLVPRGLPPCRLISTGRRGTIASPGGFVFLTIGLPGFRKGWDVAADAFRLAFRGRKGVHFVIGLTHAPVAWKEKIYRQFARYDVPIWTLEGSFSEHELARIYADCGAYVSASRGEGWNLPAAEAAACGRPIIVPDNTCHTEIFGSDAWTFPCEGTKKYPEGDWISDWYVGQRFARFGKRSIAALAEIMRTVYDGGEKVALKAAIQQTRFSKLYTWDAAADAAAARLLEVQP
jgi:glycosyltransferase involved in cell wall biosynthesis